MESLIFETAWNGMLSWLGVPKEQALPMRAEVLALYREPGRAYHNLGHALRVLKDVKTFTHRWGVENYGAVQLAALLHDVFYDTHRRDNEARSADFAMHWGRTLGLAPELYSRTAEIILATREHALTDDRDTGLVLDADMAILASPWEQYEIYRRAIRREYGWVSETDWITGRGKVLTAFLAQDRIYQIPAHRLKLEPAARSNLERELSQLGVD